MKKEHTAALAAWALALVAAGAWAGPQDAMTAAGCTACHAP